MELQDYLAAIRRHWKGFAAFVLGGILVAAAITLLMPREYTASASGMVQSDANSTISNASISDFLAKSRAKSYVDVAQSRAVAERVIESLDLPDSPSALVTRVDVTQPTDTVLLRVTATATSPVEASRLADAWIHALADQVKAIENPTGTKEGALTIVPLEAAALPSTPSAPRPDINLILGANIGFLLGLGFALLAARADRRLRSPEDVETAFDVTVAGAVPDSTEIHRDKGDQVPIVVTHDKARGSAVAEAFLKMRTNLTFMHVDKPPRVIVVTSPMPGDGKSTVAANLAAAFAVGGSPTVLIDADLRRPVVAESFGLIEGVGLSNVLAGQAEIDDVLQHTAIPNLDVLASGTVPPNPSELLGSVSMKRLLDELSQDAVVILDAPPLLPVTDAAVLTANSDGALVVISEGRTEDRQLAGCLSQLETVHGTALGVVLNKVSKSSGRSYYYSGYYYSGYYGSSDTPVDDGGVEGLPAPEGMPVVNGAFVPAGREGGRLLRQQALRLVTEGGRPPVQVARELGVSEATLEGWLERAGRDGGGATRLSARDHAELERLRAENAELQLDRDALKRAMELLAKESAS